MASSLQVTNPRIAIREAVAADASVLEHLYRELVDDPKVNVRPEQIATIAATPATFLYVLETEAGVCASVHLTLCPDAMYGTQPFALVENVIVSGAMRGRGLGRHLLAHVEAVADANHCTKIMLLSSHTRTEAHAFFRRCGFESETKRAFVKYRRSFSV